MSFVLVSPRWWIAGRLSECMHLEDIVAFLGKEFDVDVTCSDRVPLVQYTPAGARANINVISDGMAPPVHIRRAEAIALLCTLNARSKIAVQGFTRHPPPTTALRKQPVRNDTRYRLPFEAEKTLCSLLAWSIGPKIPVAAVCVEETSDFSLDVRVAINKCSKRADNAVLRRVANSLEELIKSVRHCAEGDSTATCTAPSVSIPEQPFDNCGMEGPSSIVRAVQAQNLEPVPQGSSQMTAEANSGSSSQTSSPTPDIPLSLVMRREVILRLSILATKHPQIRNMRVITHEAHESFFVRPDPPKDYQPNLDNTLARLSREHDAVLGNTGHLAQALGLAPKSSKVRKLQDSFASIAKKAFSRGTIHSEMQLAIYYATLPADTTRRIPRTTAATLDTCALCWMTMKIHGIFSAEMTSGTVSQNWRLPWACFDPNDVFAASFTDELERCAVEHLQGLLRLSKMSQSNKDTSAVHGAGKLVEQQGAEDPNRVVEEKRLAKLKLKRERTLEQERNIAKKAEKKRLAEEAEKKRLEKEKQHEEDIPSQAKFKLKKEKRKRKRERKKARKAEERMKAEEAETQAKTGDCKSTKMAEDMKIKARRKLREERRKEHERNFAQKAEKKRKAAEMKGRGGERWMTSTPKVAL